MRVPRAALRWAGVTTITWFALCPPAGGATALKARIALDQPEGLPGSLVTGTGDEFDAWSVEGTDRVGGEDAPGWTTAGPVRIRWDSVDGPLLWEGAPGLDGEVSFAFHVPERAAPGRYTVVATQTGYDGKPSGGTPARATFHVLGPEQPQQQATPNGSRAEPPRSQQRASAPATRADAPPSRDPAPNSGAAAARSPATPHVEPLASPGLGGPVRAARQRPARDKAPSPSRVALSERAANAPSAAARESTRAAAASDRRLEWYVIVLGALALSSVGALILRRRRGRPPAEAPRPVVLPEAPGPKAATAVVVADQPRAPGAAEPVVLPDPPDPLERELQELLRNEGDRAPDAPVPS